MTHPSRAAAQLAEAIAETASPDPSVPLGLAATHVVYGVVQSIQTDGTVTVAIAGLPTPSAGVGYLGSYTPVVGDTVMMLASAHDHVIMGLLGQGVGLGFLGRARSVTPTGNFTTTMTPLVGLSKTVTVGANRSIEFFVKTRVTSTVNDDPMTIYLLRDGVIFDTNDYAHQPGVSEPQCFIATDEAPAAGPHTYSVAAVRGSAGTGTLSNSAGATKPSLLIIKDIGAFS